jgi:hypothetical protein
MFDWKDSFIIIGQARNDQFNLTTQTWTRFFTSPPTSIALLNPACIVLPNKEILVVGNSYLPFQGFIYNHVANTWRTLPNTNAPQGHFLITDKVGTTQCNNR